MKTFATLLVVATLFTAFNAAAQSSCSEEVDTLQANLISATLTPRSLWWDGSSAGFEYPAGSGEQLLFAGGIWVSAIHRGGFLAVATQQYGMSTGSYDFTPGPLIAGTATTDDNPVFCKVAKVSRAQVAAHLSDLADGSLDSPIEAIVNWPARGNVALNLLANAQDLAPFVDVDGDGKYDAAAGDYPDFRGDKAAWWVINDNISHEQTVGTTPLRVEIQVLAQAFAEDEHGGPGKSQLYTIRAINKSPLTQDSFSLSLWADVDTACGNDHYIGSIPQIDALYFYKYFPRDSTFTPGCPLDYDQHEPILTARVLQTKVSGSPVVSRNSAAIAIDDSANSSSAHLPNEYFNVMHGRWKDGRPMTVGGNGAQGQGSPTNWHTHGNPADSTSWSPCTRMMEPDGRVLLNTNLLQPLAPGEAYEVDFAVVVVDNVSHPCPDTDSIANEVEKASNHLVTSNTSSSKEVRAKAAALSVWPNPSSGRFQATLPDGVRVKQIRVLDVGGRTVAHQLHNQTPTTLDLELESNGVYLISIEDESGYFRYGRVVVR